MIKVELKNIHRPRISRKALARGFLATAAPDAQGYQLCKQSAIAIVHECHVLLQDALEAERDRDFVAERIQHFVDAEIRTFD